MNAPPFFVSGWRLCALVCVAMFLLSLIPQIHLWIVRGRDWNGTYATLQGDEFLYSAYVNALVDGRPRRNDPFAGRDCTAASPLPESTFSIQFLPTYLLALSARALRVSTSTAFIMLMGATGLFAGGSVFWLLSSVTGDGRVAACGAILVLCLGELAGDQGIVGVLLLNHKLSVLLPFLRRYQPAAAFPLFFVFCGLIWKALSVEHKRGARIYSLLGGLALSALVFSYFYLWTAAAAWLACVAGLWIIFRSKERIWQSFSVFAITFSMLIVSLIAYASLIAKRSTSLDDAQILVLTRRLDLFHTPELIGAFILLSIVIGVRLGKIKISNPRAIFSAAFALLPFIVFNQQVLTGRSVQPFHYELFVVNYTVVVSVIILRSLLWKPMPGRALFWIAAMCLSWGMLEAGLLANARSASDVQDDQAVPVLLKLKELAKDDGTLSGLRSGKAAATVFSPHVDVMRIIPTWTSHGSLLGAGAQDFGSATRKERVEMLYLQLYFSGADAARFREYLNQWTEDLYMNFYCPSVIFGDERLIPALSLHPKPIQQEEIEEEVRAYQDYVDSFSRARVLLHPLTYAITRAEREPDLFHLDLWYERDAGERVGAYNLYRLKLRE